MKKMMNLKFKKVKKNLISTFFITTSIVCTLFISSPPLRREAFALEGKTEKSYILPQGTSATTVGESNVFLRKMQEGFISVVNKVRPAVVFISISKSVNAPDYFYLDPFQDLFGFGNPFGRQQNENGESELGNGYGPKYGQNQRGRNPRRSPPKNKKLEQVGLGSGFIIDNKKGYILTNNHVVGDADEIVVHTHDGKKYEAKVLGTDEKTDVAVIQVKDLPASLGQIYLADSSKIQIGEMVIAVGAPLGLDQTVTSGIISAKGRGSLKIAGYGDFIQTDAAINPGNSGGPLLNIDGDAIGMNTAIFSRSGGSQGIGFAIPSKILGDVVIKLIREGKVERAYLGVLIQDLTEELSKSFGLKNGQEGVLVSQVEEGGPADKGGVKEGDVITKIDGISVKSAEQLSYVVGMTETGKSIKVNYIRNGSEKEAQVKLKSREEGQENKFKHKEEQESSEQKEFWGMLLEENKKDFGLPIKQGLVVTQVEDSSPAAKGGIEPGDVILEVNHTKVKSLSEFKKLKQNKETILLRVAKGNYYFYVTLKKAKE